MYHRLNGEMTKMYPLVQNPFSCTLPALRGTYPVSADLIGERTSAGSYEGHALPRPDDRPRPSASSGVPVRGCAQADSGGR